MLSAATQDTQYHDDGASDDGMQHRYVPGLTIHDDTLPTRNISPARTCAAAMCRESEVCPPIRIPFSL